MTLLNGDANFLKNPGNFGGKSLSKSIHVTTDQSMVVQILSQALVWHPVSLMRCNTVFCSVQAFRLPIPNKCHFPIIDGGSDRYSETIYFCKIKLTKGKAHWKKTIFCVGHCPSAIVKCMLSIMQRNSTVILSDTPILSILSLASLSMRPIALPVGH